jgi:hypothetical protein
MISYKDTLLNGLNQLVVDFNLLDTTIDVFDEKSYSDDVINPDNITVVIKYLTGTILYTSTILPIQMMVICEENSLQIAKMLMEAYGQQNNFKSITIDGNFVKQSFSTTSVVNNFNPVGVGFRSLIFMSGSLTITGDVVDVTSLRVDGPIVKFISASISYGADPDTQPFPNEKLNVSIKRFASLSFAVQVPHTNSAFCQKIINIMRGNTSGNTKFSMEIVLSNSVTITQNFLMVSSTFNTTAGDLPTIQIGFVR